MEMDPISLSKIRVERPSWEKFIKRLHFQFWRIKTNFRLNVLKVLYTNFNYDKSETECEEYCDDNEEECSFIEDLERQEQEYIAARPLIEPRRTVLIYTGRNEHGCNFITTRRFERYIMRLYERAMSWGMTSFIVDTATPFGLLAFETLLALREHGEKFNVYVFQSRTIDKCKSFRLAPETDIERMELIMNADYFYKSYNRDIFFDRVIRCAGVIYTENRAYVSREHIPDYLLEAWEVSL